MFLNNNIIKWLASCLCVVLCWHAAADKRPMTAVDMVELSKPTAPALSPDRSQLVYLRGQTDWEKNKSSLQLYVVDVASGESRKLFDKLAPDERHSIAKWSPDGQSLVTALKRKGDKFRQIYRYTVKSQSLERLTEHGADITGVSWSADGNGVYFSTRRAVDAKRSAKKDWFIKEYETKQQNEIWYLNADTLKTHLAVGGDYFVRGFDESRDGQYYLYSRAAHGHIDRPGSELWLRDVVSGAERQITDNSFGERSAKLSPDNRYVAFVATVNDRGEQYYEDNLFIQSVDSNKPELILPKMAMELERFQWDATGQSIFLTGNTGLRTQLYRYTIKTAELEPLTDGDHVVAHWSYRESNGAHTFVMRDATQPGEVFTLDPQTGDMVRLTFDQRGVEQSFKLPKQEAVQWRGRGRTDIEGLLIYPLDYSPVKKKPFKPFPLVTISHGGPRSSAQFGSWNVSRYVPVLAAQGYGILLPNYRGGHGYGDKFARSMVGDYFRHSHHDVMDGIDHLVKQGLADPDQLIKMGWSAGGHMTNKLITHTSRFKAASSGAGVADWVSLFAESDVRYNRTPWFGGAPWEKNAPLKSYSKQSPLKDAWRITTPTLFWGGNNDVRVPPTQAIMIYRAAKAAGVETELYLAPKQPHNFQLPTYKLFKINTELAWFAKHLKGPVYTPQYPDAFYKDTAAEVKNTVDAGGN